MNLPRCISGFLLAGAATMASGCSRERADVTGPRLGSLEIFHRGSTWPAVLQVRATDDDSGIAVVRLIAVAGSSEVPRTMERLGASDVFSAELPSPASLVRVEAIDRARNRTSSAEIPLPPAPPDFGR